MLYHQLRNPTKTLVYTVTYTDENGCSASDDVTIIYDPIIYVPNAFTPGDNGLNSEFFAVGGNIKAFTIDIFDRWGELIYTGDALDKAWDGTYKGRPCQDGVYTWKIKYYDFLDKEYQLVGHVFIAEIALHLFMPSFSTRNHRLIDFRIFGSVV